MTQIDLEAAPLDTIGKKIGEELRAHAKKHGGINTLVASSGVSRSTLNRLFRGNPVSTDVLLRVLRSLERWDILNLLTEPPRLTPIEHLRQVQKSSKTKSNTQTSTTQKSSHSNEAYSHVKMADPKTILTNLKKPS